MIIAVDGTTASGKGTIARALAAHFDLPYLDTGLLYRATAFCAKQRGLDMDDEAAVAGATDFELNVLDNPDLRLEDIGALASKVSAYPAVRAALLTWQRDFAAQPGGAILDGRDIGTVIAPHADVKIFVTASLDVRVKRRHAEMQKKGVKISFAEMRDNLAARDARDSSRKNAPLQQAEDALLLNSDNLTIDAAVQRAIALVNSKKEGVVNDPI